MMGIIQGATVLLLYAAAFAAFRLTRITGHRLAWALVAAAMLIMAAVRSITLFLLVSGQLPNPPGLVMELASLAISILMLAGLAWVASDSLSLTRSWRELKESEAQHRAILNIFPDPLFRLNREGKFLGFYNDKPGSLYIQDDQIVGKNVRESLPQEVSALIEEKIEQTLENGEIQVFEFELPWPDEMKSYETRSVATGDDEVLAIVRNITESKRAEEDLRTTTSRLTALIVNLQAGILVEDSSRRIALVNQAFCDMFGIPAPPQALVGADCSNAAEESKGLFAEPERFVERIDELLRERHLAAGVLPPVPRTPDSSLRN